MITKDYLSPSSARYLNESTAHLLNYWNSPKDEFNPDFIFGIAFESLLVSGELPPDFVIYEKPEPDKTMTGENRKAWHRIILSGKTPIKIEDYQMAQRLADNCRPYRSQLNLENCQRQVKCEVELFGVKWVGYCDLADGNVIEVKTAADASMRGINKFVHKYLTHLQLYVYKKALGADGCYIIAGEKKAPYMTNYVKLSPEWEVKAEALCELLSNRFRQWQQASEMLGRPLEMVMYGGSRQAVEISPEPWM